jgi:hypothetical protein
MSKELDIRSLTIKGVAKLLKVAPKMAILDRHVDGGRLFGAHAWDTLPTRYLTAYTPADKLAAMGAVARECGDIRRDSEGTP